MKKVVKKWNEEAEELAFGVPMQSPEHKIRQSINAKVERSENDVIKSINLSLGALFILQLLDLIVTIAKV